MRGYLVRVGIDQSFGGWNAPAHSETDEFVYVPIPEMNHPCKPGLATGYAELLPSLNKFCDRHGVDLEEDLGFPAELVHQNTHLDPDFSTLTYGDIGHRRGKDLKTLKAGDLVVFYAGLRNINKHSARLNYALIGILVVSEVVLATTVSQAKWHENAHTRRQNTGHSDIIIRGESGSSGRFDRCVPVGEYRNNAYRVRKDLLLAWDGLSVNDGYVQRSVRPPEFEDAAQFYEWLKQQDIQLQRRNY